VGTQESSDRLPYDVEVSDHFWLERRDRFLEGTDTMLQVLEGRERVED
jgi:hypothetical protein